jgi:hypothetical protein
MGVLAMSQLPLACPSSLGVATRQQLVPAKLAQYGSIPLNYGDYGEGLQPQKPLKKPSQHYPVEEHKCNSSQPNISWSPPSLCSILFNILTSHPPKMGTPASLS